MTEVSLLGGGKQNNTHNDVILTANYNNVACTTIKYLKTSTMYIEIHPQCTWQKSYMTSPPVITIALWELLNKILFLWKMSQCGYQNFSLKCISFDYYYYFESRGKKERWQPKELHPYSSGGGFPQKDSLSGEVGHHLGIWDALSEVSVKLRNGIWIWSLSQNFCLTANSKAFTYGLIWIDPSLFASQPNFCQKKNNTLISTLIPFCILIVTCRKTVFSN